MKYFCYLCILLFLSFIELLHSYDTTYDWLNPPVNSTNFKSYFAICAVIKNEPDIREWVSYHYKMGCGKFFLRDNGNIPVAPMLRDFIKKGIVEVQMRKDRAPQLSVYHRCLRTYRHFHRFMAFIDGDEFIVTKQQCSIPSVLKRYESYGGLTMNWMIYGSSGHVVKPKNGVIANYWKCYPYEHVKSIVNTNYGVSHYGNPHIFHFSHGKYSVDTDFFQVSTPVNLPRPSLYEILHLNHYHLKSKEDYDRNKKRGRASTTEPSRKNEEYFRLIDAKCDRNCSILKMPIQFANHCPDDYFRNIPFSLE
jgi:hypothetical protein